MAGVKFKKHGRRILAVVAVAIVILVDPHGPEQGRRKRTYEAPAMVSTVYAQHDHGGERKDQIWTCSMHPQIRLPNPGKCPICAMDLIPVGDEGGSAATEKVSMRRLVLSETAQKLAQIQVSPVERKPVEVTRRLVGKLTYDERRVAYITAWISGRLDRLYVNFTGTMVDKGQPMVYLYSPELLAAQSEFLHAVRAVEDLRKSGSEPLRSTAVQTVQSSKEKLRRWGLTDAQINEILQRGTPSDHVTILSPMSGTVVFKDGFEGMYVNTGTRIYTIADLSSLWLKLDAYESDLSWIRVGNRVRFETESYPGEEFTGTVSFMDPFLDEETRTIKVRVDVANPDGRLRPGMFVRAVLHAPLGADELPLVIPDTAPLLTGKRAVVYVAVPDMPGTYEGREVVLGPRAGAFYVVRHGLKEGEMVVTHGNFKIDSAVQLLAKPSMMAPEAGGIGMHHHGQTAPTVSEARIPTEPVKVPDTFRRQLIPVMESFEAVRRAVAAQDWASARRAYRNLQSALDQVDGDLLSGHPWRIWNDLSMQLKNDVILGGNAKKEGERLDALTSLEKHMQQLMTHFALDHPNAVKGLEPPKVPEAFRKQLFGIIRTYLEMHNALAADKTDEAFATVAKIRAASSRVDMSLMKGDIHMTWMHAQENIQNTLALMETSQDVDHLRKGFATLSIVMANLAKTFGLGSENPLYLIRCPMAFEGQGATWLQPDKEVRNPYFGAQMLRCGEVLEVIR
ncbi:MAG: efflux RND transporter periplasmic adaptor subunit [Desulfosoma sp.]